MTDDSHVGSGRKQLARDVGEWDLDVVMSNLAGDTEYAPGTGKLAPAVRHCTLGKKKWPIVT